MATRKRNIKRTTTVRANAKTKRRRTPVSSRRNRKTGNILNTLVPLCIMVVILFCLGFLLFKGYQTVTASTFFDVKNIDIRGTSRVSNAEIEKIVRREAEKDGVWNARLENIKTGIEALSYVKTVVVSRILPDGISVKVDERIPRAVVSLETGDFWVDDDGVIVAKLDKKDSRPPFFVRGWDETKSENSQKDNQERVKMYLKVKDELQKSGLEKKVSALNISELDDVQVIVKNSVGTEIPVSLGTEDFSRRLQNAFIVIEEKGDTIKSLISHGENVRARNRNS